MVALSRAYGERPISLNELAESESISLSYLEQLFAELRKAGLVTSVRGAYGGYRLAKRPEEITVGDVVRPLEPVSLTSCTDPGASRDCCTRRPDCATRVFWQGVNARLTEALDSTTLANLIVGAPALVGAA
jgi:Rrf2 family cysteine metabolism transcriptional repressor